MSFLYTLLPWNPSWRSSAQEALKHAYFRGPKGSAANMEATNQAGNISGGSNRTTQMEETVAGNAVAIANKRNTNARVLNEGEEDYERLRESLRHKSKVAQSKSLDDINAKANAHAQNHVNPPPNEMMSNAHSQQDIMAKDDDLSDLISAFGISPDIGRRRQTQQTHAQRVVEARGAAQVANPPSFKAAVTRRLLSREESDSDAAAKATTSLKNRMPRFSNLDQDHQNQNGGISRAQQSRARAHLQLQLQRQMSQNEKHQLQSPQHQQHQQNHQHYQNHQSTSPTRNSGNRMMLNGLFGPQANGIAASMPKLNASTKYTALYRPPNEFEHSDVGFNSGLINGAATTAIPVYASAAVGNNGSAAGGGYTPSFGSGNNTSMMTNGYANPHRQQNGVVSNGFVSSPHKDPNKAVSFSTNKALAATSPLYSEKVSPSAAPNKFFSPFRSLPDFNSDKKTGINGGMVGKANGSMPQSNSSYAMVANGQAKQQQQQQQPKPRPVIHVRTNWAAKYLK